MKKRKLILIIISFVFALEGMAQFTPGNIVVYRIGEGTGTSINLGANEAFPVFLDEYTLTGTLVRSVAIPVTDAGFNKALTASSSDAVGVSGMLNRSVDGQFLTFTGYNAPIGTTGLGSTRSAINNRVIGIVKYDGTVNTSTALADFSSRNAPISAVSTNGVDIWCAGMGRADGSSAFRYTTSGSRTSTGIITSPVLAKYTTIAGGQLYMSSGSTIYTIGTGMPTTAGQLSTILPGSTLNGSIAQFALIDINPSVAGVDVLYLADDLYGLQKYSLVGGAWVLNGTIGSDLDDYRGLSVIVSGTNVNIYATRKGGNSLAVGGGELVNLTDASGHNGTFSGTPTVIASNLTDKGSFRGIALAPEKTPLCSAPVNVNVYNLSPSGAYFSWNGTSPIGYEYEVSASPIPPLKGTGITATNYQATGLTKGQIYYFHVRSNCGNFNYSSWTTISFTPACTGPSTVVVNEIGNKTEIKWNSVFSATEYEYVITSSAAAPASGAVTVDTGFTADNLSSVSQYYIHVRSKCGSGYSTWTTKPYKTTCLLPVVTNISTGDISEFAWNRINGVANYEYALTTYRTPPVGGTLTLDTSVQFSKLSSGVSYYLHVRAKCAEAGGISGWASLPFQTTGLDAYPNPVTNTLTIKVYGLPGNNGEILISDVMGRIVRRIVMTTNSVDVGVMDLAAGVYLIKYTDGTNKYTVKVLKK
jgi:hypothetical protein